MTIDPKPWMAEAFGRTADTYDQVIPMCGMFAEDLLTVAAPQPGEDALDVACGRGAVTIPLARAVAPAVLTAVDLSAGMIRRLALDLAEHDIDNVSLRVGDAEHLVAPAESLDLVTCGYGVQYFYNPDLFCTAAAETLRTGGRLVASIPLMMTAPWNVYNELVPRYARRSSSRCSLGRRALTCPRCSINAAGLDDLEESTVTRSFVLSTFDDWWTWTLSHGHRIFLDGLSEHDRDEFKREAKDRMESHRIPAGYQMEWTTQIVLGRKTRA